MRLVDVEIDTTCRPPAWALGEHERELEVTARAARRRVRPVDPDDAGAERGDVVQDCGAASYGSLAIAAHIPGEAGTRTEIAARRVFEQLLRIIGLQAVLRVGTRGVGINADVANGTDVSVQL